MQTCVIMQLAKRRSFNLKMHQKSFGGCASPELAERAYRTPRPSSWIYGVGKKVKVKVGYLL